MRAVKPGAPRTPCRATAPRPAENQADQHRTHETGRSARDMLVVLRRKLAAQIDSDDLPGHALAQLVRQFRDVDAQIRGIDARAARWPP